MLAGRGGHHELNVMRKEGRIVQPHPLLSEVHSSALSMISHVTEASVAVVCRLETGADLNIHIESLARHAYDAYLKDNII